MKIILKTLSFTALSAMFAVMLWFLNSVSTNIEPQKPPCSSPAEIVQVVMDGVEFAIPNEYQPRFDNESGKPKPIQYGFYNEKGVQFGYCQAENDKPFQVQNISFNGFHNYGNNSYARKHLNVNVISKITSIQLKHTTHARHENVVDDEHALYVYKTYNGVRLFDNPIKLGCTAKSFLEEQVICRISSSFTENIQIEAQFSIYHKIEKDPVIRARILHYSEKDIAIKEMIRFVESIIVKK
jgi:hypothetical protein